MSGKTRFHLELSADEIARLEWMQGVAGLATRKDLINEALTAFEWMLREAADGRKIGSFDDATRERTVLATGPLMRVAAARGSLGRPQ